MVGVNGCASTLEIVSQEMEAHLRYDVVVDPTEETSHGKLVRYAGQGTRVLDLGCATGGIARALVDRGCRVWGVEIDPVAAELAEGACERVVVGDLDSTDLRKEFAGQRFDVVIAGDVLEHVLRPADVLRDVAELLDDGGYIVLSVPNMAHGSVRLALLHGELPPSDTGLLDRTHIHYLTRTSVTDLLEGAGYSIALLDSTVAPIDFPDVPFPDDALTAAVRPELELDPDAHAYQYVVIAYPGTIDELPPVAGLLRARSEDLRKSRLHATAWEARGLAAERRVAELDEELVEASSEVDVRAAAALAPLRQELLVARDQLMHRDHDVQRVVAMYERHTAALQDSEEDRRRLHAEILRSHAESAELMTELTAVRATTTWRVGQTIAQLIRGQRPRRS